MPPPLLPAYPTTTVIEAGLALHALTQSTRAIRFQP